MPTASLNIFKNYLTNFKKGVDFYFYLWYNIQVAWRHSSAG